MMEYFKQWQLKHPTSLNSTYQSMCSLLHTSVCLLIRPSVLKMLIDQNNRNQDQNQGIGTGASMGNAAAEIQKARRRLSSKGATTNEDSYLCLDNGNNSGEPISLIGYVQNKLLEIVGSCLKMLSFLSPDLVALLTDDLVDHSSYIELLQMGFSSPTFEQDEIGALTYGTIVSISNLCIKNLARIPQQPNERSPSPPTKSASASSPEATTTGGHSLDRRQLLMVLERSLYVLLSQALLILSHERGLSLREKQLLRRELGAELGSITESMKRYVQKGVRGLPERRSPCLLAANDLIMPPKSPANQENSTSVLSKSDETFMKYLSEIVQKAFK